MDQPEEGYYDQTDYRNSCVGAISNGAVSSNDKHTINDVLSGVLAAVPAMRCQQYSLLPDIQLVHRAVSQQLPELS